MTAIVTGTDGRSYVHEMAGEPPVFVTATVKSGTAPRAALAGHARLVAWLLPVEAGMGRRARVRLPAGEIVEVAAEAVCSAANIAWARIAPARRAPAVRACHAPPCHGAMREAQRHSPRHHNQLDAKPHIPA